MKIILPLAIIILSAIIIDQLDPEDLIIGEWDGVKPEGIHWKFTATELIKNNDSELKYSYNLIYGATMQQCKGSGYDAVYNSDQLVLIQTYKNYSQCFMVETLTEERFVLFNETDGKYLSFKKQTN